MMLNVFYLIYVLLKSGNILSKAIFPYFPHNCMMKLRHIEKINIHIFLQHEISDSKSFNILFMKQQQKKSHQLPIKKVEITYSMEEPTSTKHHIVHSSCVHSLTKDTVECFMVPNQSRDMYFSA